MDLFGSILFEDISFHANILFTSAKQEDQPGVILETEGSIQKTQKRALFHYKTVKKGTPNLTSPYVHGLFAIVFIK